MINALTIDLEDYYQVSAFDGFVKREDWDRFESRLERNTYRLLEILDQYNRPNNSINTSNSSNPTNQGNPINPINQTAPLAPYAFY
jgi:hypothetical protein